MSVLKLAVEREKNRTMRKKVWRVIAPGAASEKAVVRLAILLGLALYLLASTQARAQVIRATLSGKITGPSGGVIQSAKLVIKNLRTGQTSVVKTNKEGLYRAARLAPGTYKVTVTAPGFNTAVRTGITLAAGAKRSFNLRMGVQAGQAAGAARAVPLGSSTVGSVVSSKTVRAMPLNGRSGSDLAALQPGVATARTQGSGQAQRGFGTQMTISGSRPRQNNYRLDGISVNDYTNGPPGSALGLDLGVDAVKRISVQTSNYPAAYGRSSGGIISAVTRSGTNKFHGDVYEFLRNSTLDARNFFDVTIPPFRRNQFGVSAGGPIQHDKTYFFGDYEGLRQSLGITNVNVVPSAAARAGNLSTGAVVVNPTVLRFVGAFYPLPNGAALGAGDTGTFAFSGQEVTPENYWTTRIDRNFSDQDKLSGTYMFDSGTVRQPSPLNDMRTGYDSRRQVFTIDEAHTFSPHLINSFRFGISRDVVVSGLTFPTGNAAVSDTSFGVVPGRNAPTVDVPGLTEFPGALGGISSYHFHWTSLQAYDDASFTRGKHSWKFGANLERIRDNILALSDPAGSFSFNSLPDFLSNVPYFLGAAIPSTLTERGLRQTIAGTYAEDQWKWYPNLTVNLGLRYEMATVPTEVQGKLSTLRHLTDAQPHLGNPYFSNPTLHNFEPRVGFSWDPFRDGKTAVSGGFGVFDVLPLPYEIQFNSVFSAPFFQDGNTTNLPAGSFPGGAFAFVSASPSTFRQAFFEPNPQRNYVMQWNFNIQRQLANGFTMMAGYVGSRAVHQPFRVEDADIVMPTLTPQGYLWPSPAGSGTRLNLNAGRITAGFWEADSFYDALELQFQKRMSHGFQFEGSYTWGKTIDTGSSSMVGDEYSNSISSPLWFNTKLNRGLADFNVAQDLELSYSWALPTPRRVTGVSAWALGGWQIGGIYAASTGVPFTASFGGDALGLKSTDPTLDVPNVISGPGCSSLTNPGNPIGYIKTRCFAVPSPITLRGNLGRNTLIGPGLSNFDFSLFKNNHIKEFNVQLRAEFFNIFNRANFAPPLDNRALFDSNGNPIGNAGLITQTQTPSREIQLAVKVIW